VKDLGFEAGAGEPLLFPRAAVHEPDLDLVEGSGCRV